MISRSTVRSFHISCFLVLIALYSFRQEVMYTNDKAHGPLVSDLVRIAETTMPRKRCLEWRYRQSCSPGQRHMPPFALPDLSLRSSVFPTDGRARPRYRDSQSPISAPVSAVAKRVHPKEPSLFLSRALAVRAGQAAAAYWLMEYRPIPLYNSSRRYSSRMEAVFRVTSSSYCRSVSHEKRCGPALLTVATGKPVPAVVTRTLFQALLLPHRIWLLQRYRA